MAMNNPVNTSSTTNMKRQIHYSWLEKLTHKVLCRFFLHCNINRMHLVGTVDMGTVDMAMAQISNNSHNGSCYQQTLLSFPYFSVNQKQCFGGENQ